MNEGFLYFCPVNSVTEITDEIYNDFPHLRDNIGTVRNVVGSPENKQGIIFTQQNVFIDVSYKPSQQKWKKCGSLWVCYIGIPSETSLRKKWQGFNFSLVKLADGNEYRIIVAKSFNEIDTLPQKISLSEDGELEKGDVVDYATPYYVIAEKYRERFLVNEDYLLLKGSGDKNILTDNEVKEIYHDCAFILAGLYNIGKYEISYLELFTIENMQRVLGALCDYLVLQEAMKSEEYRRFAEENYREKIEVAKRNDDVSELL